MSFVELLDLYKGMLVFSAAILAGVAYMARRHIQWSREDKEKRERGM